MSKNGVVVVNSNGEVLKNVKLVVDNSYTVKSHPFVKFYLGNDDVFLTFGLNGFRLFHWVLSKMNYKQSSVRLWHKDYTFETGFDYQSFKRGMDELIANGVVEESHMPYLFYVNRAYVCYGNS